MSVARLPVSATERVDFERLVADLQERFRVRCIDRRQWRYRRPCVLRIFRHCRLFAGFCSGKQDARSED